MDKGCFSLSVKLPRNYFYYNEKIPIEINIDCSKLKDLNITFINLLFFLQIRKNNSLNLMKASRSIQENINSKKINLEKGLIEYKISEIIEFPNDFKYYTPLIYNEFDKIGPIELNNSVQQQLFQSSYNGLVSVDYIIKICFCWILNLILL